MPVDSFEKEVGQIQTRFNQTFGVMPLCNPKVRARTIFAIMQMCILKNRIMSEKRKEDISRFCKIKDKLNKIFSMLTKESERRSYDNRIESRKSQTHKSGNGRSGDMQLSKVRDSLSNQIFRAG
jgi:hypothetical protein